MTNKEAIEVLNKHLRFYKISNCTTDAEAVSLGIKALEDKPTGKWDITKIGYYKCSECRCEREIPEHFCGYCGTRMEADNE